MFLCRSDINPRLILTTLRPDGSGHEWKHQDSVGPGGYSAKLFKTRKGAERVRSGHVVVEEVA